MHLHRAGARVLIALWAHIVGSAIFRIVPRQVGYVLADLLGPTVARAWGGQYARATRNMRTVLGPGAPSAVVHRQVRQVFRNYARYLIDVLCLPSMGRPELERAVDVVGWEHIPNALARGNGMLLVTGHIGNWDVPAALLAARGFPVNVIVERLEPPTWNERVQAIRERAGLRAIPMETGAREMFACLRRNEVLALLIDRPLAEGGTPVRLFERETRIPDGVARLALRTGAVVVGAVGLRRGSRFTAVVSPPLAFQPTSNRERDVGALTQLIATWLERQIRQHPSQWYMFRDMWPPAKTG